MVDVLLPGVAASRVETARAVQHVLHPADQTPIGSGEAVLFVHGNVSSAVFWQQQLLALAETGRHPALAVDLRGYGDAEPLQTANHGARTIPWRAYAAAASARGANCCGCEVWASL